MDTIWVYEAGDDMELDITFSFTVYSGKVKLVLISPDNTVTTIQEFTEDSDMEDDVTSRMAIKKGKNRIKLVAGKQTKFDFDITILEGEFGELGF